MYNYRRRSLVGRLLGGMEMLAYMVLAAALLLLLCACIACIFFALHGDFSKALGMFLFGFTALLISLLFLFLVQTLLVYRAKSIDPTLFVPDMKGMCLREGVGGQGHYEAADWYSLSKAKEILEVGKS